MFKRISIRQTFAKVLKVFQRLKTLMVPNETVGAVGRMEAIKKRIALISITVGFEILTDDFKMHFFS